MENHYNSHNKRQEQDTIFKATAKFSYSVIENKDHSSELERFTFTVTEGYIISGGQKFYIKGSPTKVTLVDGVLSFSKPLEKREM